MNPFVFLSLIALIVSISLASIALVRNPKGDINRIFAFFCVLVTYAAFTEFGYRQADSFEGAVFWLRMESFWPFVLSALLHFTLAFTGQSRLLKNKTTWVILYVPALFFSFLDLFKHVFIVTTLKQYWGWEYVTQPSFVTYIGALWVFCMTILPPYLCWRYFLRVKGNEKQQAKYVLLGMTVAAVIALPTSFLFSLLRIPFPSLTITSCTIGGIFIIYAILKYELFSLTPASAAEEIITTMSDLMFLINSERKIIRINGAVSRALGYSADEIVGKDLEVVLSLEKTDGIQSVYPMEKVGMVDVEMNLKTKTGHSIPVSVSTSVVSDKNGNTKGLVYIARDISERKQFQESLQGLYEKERVLRQDLEAEIRRRADFTRALVHELMTPLTAVIASSELLADGLKEEIRQKVINNIRQGASILESRISELLDLARGETGMLQLKLSIINPVELLQQIVGVMTPVISNRNQSLLPEWPSSLPKVLADKDRLQQVIFNLIDNASKYNGQRGRITLRATEKDDFLVVSVQDTGYGIPKEEQRYLFNPYTRLEGERRKVGGMGLGLAICKILVELHHGRIWVESDEGKGSTFTFTLPLGTVKGGNSHESIDNRR